MCQAERINGKNTYLKMYGYQRKLLSSYHGGYINNLNYQTLGVLIS